MNSMQMTATHEQRSLAVDGVGIKRNKKSDKQGMEKRMKEQPI
ncbi:hypothetical protein [Photobacterium sanguinicancri]|uniref:Uncharacterized protein n=1 Tax=Photobacterium sanguinicancri TaxID=875932 RepID=A0AAW7Y059_9GAMM|nr:hypothetical protein [Photobacterium sanguinicancri]MDO6541771.1 hypothetical protein [Photobacterium sanguinicancri]